MADVLVTLYVDGAQIRGKGYSTSMTFEITSTGFIVNNTQVWTYSGDSVFAGFSQNSGANVYPVGTTGHIGDFNISVQSLYLDSMEESEPTITYYITNSTELTSVADAIRTKGGTSESLVYPTEFVSAIENMSGNNYSTVTLHDTATITSSSYTLHSIPKTEVDLIISDIPCIVFLYYGITKNTFQYLLQQANIGMLYTYINADTSSNITITSSSLSINGTEWPYNSNTDCYELMVSGGTND